MSIIFRNFVRFLCDEGYTGSQIKQNSNEHIYVLISLHSNDYFTN